MPKAGRVYAFEMPIEEFFEKVGFALGPSLPLDEIYIETYDHITDIFNRKYPVEGYEEYYFDGQPELPNLTHPYVWDYVNKKHDFGKNLVLHFPSAEYMRNGEKYTTDRFEYPRMLSPLEVLGAIDTYFDQFRDTDPTLEILGEEKLFRGLKPHTFNFRTEKHIPEDGYELDLE
jgi:hypothetical protein